MRHRGRVLQLKYGTNPHQRFASAEPLDPSHAPVTLLNGAPSMINFLDALNAWQLVRELSAVLDLPAAASFKHLSPAGAAVAGPLDPMTRRVHGGTTGDLSPVATAYARARGADPKSSYGDFVAVSHEVDRPLADLLRSVVSDGIIAPGYQPEALERLKSKKSGGFVVLQADPTYEPPLRETREVFGMRLVQDRNDQVIGPAHLENVKVGVLGAGARRDLMLGLITLKHTQSNSVGYALHGQMIGIGAGQQSRIDCTKLAGNKADVWHLLRHPRVLDIEFLPEVKTPERINWLVRYVEGELTPREAAGFRAALARDVGPLQDDEKRALLAAVTDVALVSDGYLPFRDNIDQASRHGVRFIAEPGGASRGTEVEAACRDHRIALVHTNLRLFHH